MKKIVVIPKEHIEYEQISGAGFDTIRFHLGTDKVLEVPETFEDIKDLLDELKIEHESVYVNDKDFRWTIKDKNKILRAINIKIQMNYCYPLTDIAITINNCNEIVIRKYKYDGQEYIRFQFSTIKQVWNIFINIYKDAIKEKK